MYDVRKMPTIYLVLLRGRKKGYGEVYYRMAL